MVFITGLAIVLISAGIILLLDLRPERVAEDIIKMVSPAHSLRDRILIARGRKKTKIFVAELKRIRDAMERTGKSRTFALLCSMSLVLLFIGAAMGIAIDNLYLIPILAIMFAAVPLIYAKNVLSYYSKYLVQEMETALSIITTSYVRSEDLLQSVKENLPYLKPPINEVFRKFLGEATAIRSDTRQALLNLKGQIDSSIFRQWCDTLIACQDDRTLKATLFPVVNRLTDVRIVNSELKTLMVEPRKEYFMMVAMVVGNIPLLYLLNKDWFHSLMTTTAGKLVLAATGVIVLVTAILMMKYTKPIEYDG